MVRLAVMLICLAGAALAQERRPSHCIALAGAVPEVVPGAHRVHLAGFRDPVPQGAVRIRYVEHASFLIQTDGGLSAVTDFTGHVGNVDFVPDVVTMNHAHATHWTAYPDPAIAHVLRGWAERFGEGIEHHLDLGDMVVRNVPTDIRAGGGVEPRGNSIFVFEVAGLCIGHLGHLHHEPGPEQYAALGRLDVVMAPVDGGLTLDHATMRAVLRRLRASVVIPMHWFGEGTLGAFLAGMEGDFDIVETQDSEIVLSPETLPARPAIVVLRPSRLSAAE